MLPALAYFDSWAILSTESSLIVPGIAKDVEVKGTFAYLSTDSGLAAVDVSNPKAPVLKCFLKLPGKGNELSITGNRAYVADGGAKAAQIVDISKPESLRIVNSMGDSCGYVWGIDSKKINDTVGSIVAVASLSGLTLLKPDNIGQPILLSRYCPYHSIKNPTDSVSPCIDDTCWGYKLWIKTDDVKIDGSFAYVLYFDNYTYATPQQLILKKINILDPLFPKCVDSLALHSYGCGMAVQGGRAYVVHTSNLDLIPGMDIIDLQSSTMAIKSSMDLPGPAEDVAVEGSRAYVACAREGIRVINVSNPASPIVIDSFPLIQFSFPITTYGIALGDTAIYAAMGERGLWIFKKSALVRARQAAQKTDDSRFAITVNKTAIRIKFPHRFPSNLSVEIYALNGKALFRGSLGRIQSNEAVINAAGLANNPIQPGVYLLCVKNSEGTIFEKAFMHLQ
jgi:hypothetical protein